MNELFFELIRVSIGVSGCLSKTPTNEEWKALYDMAKKQSLLSVCFAGVQRLCNSESGNYYGMNELQYLTWMGMAAKIQQRNQVVNKQCLIIQEKLDKAGINACIVKGQTIGTYYCDHLKGLRQSGDIDVWVDCSCEDLIKYIKKIAPTDEITENHVQLHVFDDTEVELHYNLTRLPNPFMNRKLHQWLEAQKDKQMSNKIKISDGEICSPTNEFYIVYLLLHIYKHLFGEGVGLRQLMDLFFVLNESQKISRSISLQLLNSFGLKNFLSAVMYVLQKVFDLKSEYLLCEPNPMYGKWLLNEILQSGNFGHMDERFKLNVDDSHLKRYLSMVSGKIRFARQYPSDTIWTALEIIYNFFEIRFLRYKIQHT